MTGRQARRWLNRKTDSAEDMQGNSGEIRACVCVCVISQVLLCCPINDDLVLGNMSGCLERGWESFLGYVITWVSSEV